MICFWLIGDVAKLIFYVSQQQPWQFVVCAVIQIVVEVGILVQFEMYKQRDEVDEEGHDSGWVNRKGLGAE